MAVLNDSLAARLKDDAAAIFAVAFPKMVQGKGLLRRQFYFNSMCYHGSLVFQADVGGGERCDTDNFPITSCHFTFLTNSINGNHHVANTAFCYQITLRWFCSHKSGVMWVASAAVIVNLTLARSAY